MGSPTEEMWVPKSSAPNKRMHATRDTSDVIDLKLAGGRVMRGVMPPLRAPAISWAAFAPVRAAEVERYPRGPDAAVFRQRPFALL